MPLEIEYFSCLECGATYRVSDTRPGTRFECTKCGRPLTVPEPPKGSEDSTLQRNPTDLKRQIEEEKKRQKGAELIVKTGRKKKT